MIDRQALLRPLTALSASAWPLVGQLQAAVQPGVARLGRTLKYVISQCVDAAEPALDWVARQRWLGPFYGSVVGKIVTLNLIGLLLLTLAILFFSPFQASFVRSKLESLVSEAEIVAGYIASTATRETDRVVIDSELLEPGKNSELRQAMAAHTLQFPIRTERLSPIAHQVVDGSGMRMRLFRPDGTFMYDSQETQDARTSAGDPLQPLIIKSFWTRLSDWMDGTDLHVYRDLGRKNVLAYPEFAEAVKGKSVALITMSDLGKRTISILTPVKRKETLGVLWISTREAEIDKLLWNERRTVLWIGGLGLLAMAITSLLLAGTIALPLRQLANAADRVQLNLKRRQDLPDLSHRGDEIAHLSTTLRSMTEALYRRIESSERFAADVAHELKNPLTSVRSAAETLAVVKTDSDRKILTDTIQNDVKRLTRLIDDISKATRADADMALNDAAPVDLGHLLTTLTDMFNDVHVRHTQRVLLQMDGTDLAPSQAYRILGHDARLGQVFKNLLDNALSFSPPNGQVRIRMSREAGTVLIAIEDQGPGIPADNLERIFHRFYTDRPVSAFGNNSGLGLSICEEIVKAHGGKIWAENQIENTVHRTGTADLGVVETRVAGARFSVQLPATITLTGQRVARARSYGRR